MLMYNFTNLYAERAMRRRWWTEAYYLQIHVPSTRPGASPDARTILQRARFIGEPPVQMSGDAYDQQLRDGRLWVQVDPERVIDRDAWIEVTSRHIPEPKGRRWNLMLIRLLRDQDGPRCALALGFHPEVADGSAELADDLEWLELKARSLLREPTREGTFPPVEREEVQE